MICCNHKAYRYRHRFKAKPPKSFYTPILHCFRTQLKFEGVIQPMGLPNNHNLLICTSLR